MISASLSTVVAALVITGVSYPFIFSKSRAGPSASSFNFAICDNSRWASTSAANPF